MLDGLGVRKKDGGRGDIGVGLVLCVIPRFIASNCNSMFSLLEVEI
jgi:hypothetical protein